jgi:hypothetical protein
MSTRRTGRFLLRLAAGLATVYVLLSAGLYWAMTRPPDAFGSVMKHVPMPFMIILPFEPLWNHARAGGIHPGDLAPDFRLSTLDHKETVQLASFRGSRPVVLVFGSYT